MFEGFLEYNIFFNLFEFVRSALRALCIRVVIHLIRSIHLIHPFDPSFDPLPGSKKHLKPSKTSKYICRGAKKCSKGS
jgi:hypothetical protein